jgi:hypothetical protein
MNAPLNILVALAAYDTHAVIQQGRVRLVCTRDHPPPAELIEAARAHKDKLRELLEARFEERAAILEFDQGLSRAEAEVIAHREMAAGVYDDVRAERDPGPYATVLRALRAECPPYLPEGRWRQTIADARTFVSEWGEQAQAFGWTEHELFGLHPVPEQPAANYSRLSRLDQTGLIWLLRSRPVVMLTATEAVMRCQSGATLVYRRQKEPVPELLGDNAGGAKP